MQKMLAAAEADLEPESLDRCFEEGVRIEGGRPAEIEGEIRQQALDQTRLTRAQRMTFAAAEKGAARLAHGGLGIHARNMAPRAGLISAPRGVAARGRFAPRRIRRPF